MPLIVSIYKNLTNAYFVVVFFYHDTVSPSVTCVLCNLQNETMRDFKVYERRSPNAIQIICNVSTNFFYLSVECITNCIYNTHCNAIDVSGTYCRLIRGWDSLYTEQNVATTCQRFQIVRIFHLLTGVIFFFPKTCVVYNRKKFLKENNVVSVTFVVMWYMKAVTLQKNT